ncbi:MAG TPA: DNA/RNA nuclease SfsA [Candidatus Ventrimonas merdavium]|nr:DNA/RNA nuclease SfsA [Candidatus Ventrimonas merdavium]
MQYDHIIPAVFHSRPNRFIAWADVDGKRVKCHVKNTGRCKELLPPGANIYLQYHPEAERLGRKTEYSVIGVRKPTPRGDLMINMDSQAPNQVAYEWLCAQGYAPRREVTFGNSRFDLYFEENGVPAFLEVKGVTLEEDGVARFPDAPTQRGVKHLEELEHAAAEGYRAYVLFVIAMKGVRRFEPNRTTHPAFADALAHAAENGVKVLAYDCIVTEDSLRIDEPVPVAL